MRTTSSLELLADSLVTCRHFATRDSIVRQRIVFPFDSVRRIEGRVANVGANVGIAVVLRGFLAGIIALANSNLGLQP